MLVYLTCVPARLLRIIWALKRRHGDVLGPAVCELAQIAKYLRRSSTPTSGVMVRDVAALG